MTSSPLICFILYCFIANSVWANSIEMDKTTFDSLTASGIWFIEHFSPYCHFCVDFAPTWKELTDEEEGLATTHDIRFGTIDCSIHGELCIEHGITGYPKMKLYVNGKYAHTYLGARSKESIKYYLLQVHSKLAKMKFIQRDKEIKAAVFTATIDDSDSAMATTGFTDNDGGRQNNTPERSINQLNSTNYNAQDPLDDERMIILGTYGSEDEEFHHQFRTLFEQANGAAVFVEMDMETNSDLAQHFNDIQRTKVVLIVDRKNNRYYDRDMHSNLLDIQQPQHILQALDDAIAGKLKGIPIGRQKQHLEDQYGSTVLGGWYGYPILMVFAFLAVVIYKTLSIKKSPSASYTHSYANSLSKSV